MTLWFAKYRSISKPGRQPWGLSLWAGGVLAVLAAAAIWIDVPVAHWLQERPLPGDLARLVRLAEVFAWGGTVALLIGVAMTLDPRGWRVGILLAAASLGSGIAADTMKLAVGRTRPAATALDSTTSQQTFVGWLPGVTLAAKYGHALQSFPSGHAATAAGLAVGLAALYPRGRWLFFLFAVLACFQRLAAQAHWPSDVLAGAAMGCLIAGWVVQRSARGTASTGLGGELE
jgi:membrane-associated phospholipid phosphatase